MTKPLPLIIACSGRGENFTDSSHTVGNVSFVNLKVDQEGASLQNMP